MRGPLKDLESTADAEAMNAKTIYSASDRRSARPLAAAAPPAGAAAAGDPDAAAAVAKRSYWLAAVASCVCAPEGGSDTDIPSALRSSGRM